jgi:two-component system LytT family response regulator
MALRALIVEDEAVARERLRTLCALEGDIEVVGCAENASQALEFLGRAEPDLIFLDVQLRGSSAFDVLRALPANRLPLIVFTTAYAEHALEAFEHPAIDYLLKPFADERFRGAVRRARERAASIVSGATDTAQDALARVARASRRAP